MIERMATFFPPEFTAFAQWIACTLHILCTEKRLRGWRIPLLAAAMFPAMLGMNYLHAGKPALIWVLVMICCLLMMLYLRLGMKENLSVVLQHWCHVLMQAEFAAAMAYLINVYLCSLHLIHGPHTPIFRINMLIVYAFVFTPLGITMYRRAHRAERPLRFSRWELVSNFAITFGAFVLSNVSFWAPESIFGVSMGGGVLLMRTVSDFSGMMALYAMEEFSYATQLKMNVRVLQSMLDNQYAQYQQFQVNNDQMQQIYHDIKHLIHYIRSASNSQKYEVELQNMEEIVSNYEAQYDTGNSVLDVILSTKKMLCRSKQITMECYVDAREMAFLDVVHVCSIFGNALDNAIEYECQIDEIEKRLIKVSVFSENRFLMIHISNYCEQVIHISLDNPQTTKKNPERHGYGIKGIRLAVEKYNGHISLRQENNWFILSILIPLPEAREGRSLP